MKNLIDFILESDIESLKNELIKKIQQSQNDKIIKKASKLFNFSEEDYQKINENIKTYLFNHCGIKNNSTVNTICQKIKHYGLYKEINDIFNDVLDKNSTNKYAFTLERLINGYHNIFDLINEYGTSIISDEYDQNEFNNFIHDLAEFNISGKTSRGKMEILTLLFLKDLNEGNLQTPGNNNCDINAVTAGLEYKVSGGRIMGNLEQSKPLSPEMIDIKFKELIKSYFNIIDNETDTQKNKNQNSATPRLNSNIDKELSNYENREELEKYIIYLDKQKNIFRNAKGNTIEEILNPLFKFNISENDLNNIIVDSLLYQFNDFQISSKEKDFLIKTYPIAINKEIPIEGKLNLKHIFLVLHIYHYWLIEQWEYLILFEQHKKECSGNYNIITSPNSKNGIFHFDDMINKYAISSAYPAYGPGTNIQNHAPIIKFK